MKTVVITGSTRGIGFAMVQSFLKQGCRVVISGRKKASVQEAVKQLSKKFGNDGVDGKPCDVTSYDALQKLWDFSIEKFGEIDIWINNAGISNSLNMLQDILADEIQRVVETNVLGEMYGSKMALSGFIQQGHGALYNMEGMGAKKGMKVDGLSIYGSTKAGLRYFNDAIIKENKHESIIIGALLPGMMLTDMVMNQYEGKPEEWQKVSGILSAISGDVDEVADWLTEKMLTNKKNGVRLEYSNMFKILIRMIKYQFGRKSLN
jgi:NAD(P)-dependent dehydrogenase (short-subunit alcohol dehydrogenase family)